MTLRRSDLQSDSDLDSIRNSCDVLKEYSDKEKTFPKSITGAGARRDTGEVEAHNLPARRDLRYTFGLFNKNLLGGRFEIHTLQSMRNPSKVDILKREKCDHSFSHFVRS